MNLEVNGLSLYFPREEYETSFLFQERVSFFVHFYETYSGSYKKLLQLSHIWVHSKYHQNTYSSPVMQELTELINGTSFMIYESSFV